MFKPVPVFIAAITLSGCGTVIDFGPEPGTSGDEYHWHYQPELHGPEAVARQEQRARESAATPLPEAEAPPGPSSEAMFNDAIRQAVAAGDISHALRLLEEAERLGSRSARPTFIDALEGR